MHRLLILPVLLTSTLLLTSQQAAGQNENPYRTWRDRTGTYQVEARLVRIDEKEVELERKEDSKTIKVPLDALSSNDRQYLVRQQRNSAARNSTNSSANKPGSDAAAGDWPTWRGLARDGISQETGLLTEWPPAGPSVAWENSDLGGGYASVSVAAGKV